MRCTRPTLMAELWTIYFLSSMVLPSYCLYLAAEGREAANSALALVWWILPVSFLTPWFVQSLALGKVRRAHFMLAALFVTSNSALTQCPPLKHLNDYQSTLSRTYGTEESLTCSNISHTLNATSPPAYLTIPVDCFIDYNTNFNITTFFQPDGSQLFMAESVIICTSCNATLSQIPVCFMVDLPTPSTCRWDTPTRDREHLTIKTRIEEHNGTLYGPEGEGWEWDVPNLKNTVQADASFIHNIETQILFIRLCLLAVWVVVPVAMATKTDGFMKNKPYPRLEDVEMNGVAPPLPLNVQKVGCDARYKTELTRNPLCGESAVMLSALLVVMVSVLYLFPPLSAEPNDPPVFLIFGLALLWLLNCVYWKFVLPPVVVEFNDITAEVTHHSYYALPSGCFSTEREKRIKYPLCYSDILFLTCFEVENRLFTRRRKRVFHVCCGGRGVPGVVFLYGFCLSAKAPLEDPVGVFDSFATFLQARLGRDVPQMSCNEVRCDWVYGYRTGKFNWPSRRNETR